MREYYIQHNVGSARYVVIYWQGKYHADGSKLYAVRIFSNKKKMQDFINTL